MAFANETREYAAAAMFLEDRSTPNIWLNNSGTFTRGSNVASPPSTQPTVLSQLNRYIPKFKSRATLHPQVEATATRSRQDGLASQPMSQLAQVERAFEAIFSSQKRAKDKEKPLPTILATSPASSQQSRNRFLFKTPYSSQQTSYETSSLASTEEVPAKKLRPLYATSQSLEFKRGSDGNIIKLKAVAEIPERYRKVFAAFPYFNIIQSHVFDDVVYTDISMVVCAPTGSGKTAIFELAIVRLLMNYSGEMADAEFKIIYMAPIKALCSEKMVEWTEKFSSLGIKCTELTGDTDGDEYFQLQKSHIVLTTPEKWDSFTRRWRDNKSLVKLVRLFLIDEVHLLNDESRGPTMEAVVSRMKTVQSTVCSESPSHLRFIAVSATAPNVTDISEWLGSNGQPAFHFKADDDMRPVQLKKIVYDYPFNESSTDFKFDLTLSYKLRSIIYNHAEGKPTLVFCSTRKSVIQTASVLVKDSHTIIGRQQLPFLQRVANAIKDSKLKDVVPHGIAFHHAGLEAGDRRLVESTFAKGELPILICTSTLAMGVNLPAHLVIVKSTTQYVAGRYMEYTETQILQMIGRAGRPQFDSTATAVIMTKSGLRSKYESLVGGTQLIESSLHKHLIEHVNAEIVLNTISDVSIALEWIRSTFLYIRVMRNPKHYGLQENMTKDQTENKLLEMCVKDLNALAEHKIIEMGDDGFELRPTEVGRMMARYCIAFDSMKLFTRMSGKETLNDLVVLVSSCKEFSDIQLRVNEKKTLNTLNKDKHHTTIRFAMEGKIKNKEMKVNCLIQAMFGSIQIYEPSLNQEAIKIIRIGQRVTKCLSEYANLRNDYRCVLNCVLLAKCFNAKMWENSKHVARQLDKIGITLSNTLVNAGMTSFQKLADTNPRQLEMILNRNPPFGNQIQDAISMLPKFDVLIEQHPHYSSHSAELSVIVALVNWQDLKKRVKGTNFKCVLLIGDADNKLIFRNKLTRISFSQSQQWVRKLEIHKATKGNTLQVNLINEDLVGLDIQCTFAPFYTGMKRLTVGRNYENSNTTADLDKSDHEFDVVPSDASEVPCTSENNRECNHRCNDKSTCSHTCCKVGVAIKARKNVEAQQLKMDRFVDEIHEKASLLNVPENHKNTKSKTPTNVFQAIQKFQYIPHLKEKLQFQNLQKNHFEYETNEWGQLQEESHPLSMDSANDHCKSPQAKESHAQDLSTTDIYDIIDLDSDEDESTLIVYNGDDQTSMTIPLLQSKANASLCNIEDFQEPETSDVNDNTFAWNLGIDELFTDSPTLTDGPAQNEPSNSPVAMTVPHHAVKATATRAQIQSSPTCSQTDSICYVKDTVQSQEPAPMKTNWKHNRLQYPSGIFVNKDRKSLFETTLKQKENELEETLHLFHNVFDNLV